MPWDKCTEYIYIVRKGGKIFKNEVEPIKKRKRHKIIKGKETEGSVRVNASFAGEKSSEPPLNWIWGLSTILPTSSRSHTRKIGKTRPCIANIKIILEGATRKRR